MKTVRLITCESMQKAGQMRELLEKEGIIADFHAVNIPELLKGAGLGISGVDLLVPEKEFERAIAILEDNGLIPEQQHSCPYCGSPNIKLVIKKKRLLHVIPAFSLLMHTTTGFPDKTYWEYLCNQCRKRFEKPVGRKNQKE